MRKAPGLFFTAVTLLFFQRVGVASIHFTASLRGAQEVPAVTTSATGTGSFVLNDAMTELTFDITVCGLSGPITGAHFHKGAFGTVGPVVRAFTTEFVGNTVSGKWQSTDAQPLTPELVQELFAGNIYVNVHTAANPGGEIRGQLTGLGFTAKLSGAQEVPPVTTTASGTGAFSLNSARTELKFYVTVCGLSGPIVAAHFHARAAGFNGGVVRTITFSGNTAEGIWKSTDSEPLTPALIDSLLNGRLYVNIHTAANPGGEIRGQLIPQIGTHFIAQFTGGQENPPVTTTAAGTGSFTLSPDRTQLTYDLTVCDLSGAIAAAHFHVGEPFHNGPVVRTITGDFSGNTASGVWKSTDGQALTAALVDSLLDGKIYVNVHTAANPGGEIRAQLTGMGFTAKLSGANEVPPVSTTASGTGSFSLNPSRTALKFDITVCDLSGAITGAHFHTGAAGTTGPVVRGFTGEFVGNTVSGEWTSGDPQPLTTALVDSLLAGKIYVNGHTAANPGGEIRGQVLLVGTSIPETLPVELTSFSARSDAGNVVLSWTTASETNNLGFEVERAEARSSEASQDNVQFVKLGFVSGAGTSTTPKSYEYLDRSVASGTYYYRLKQVDTDGAFTYSRIVEVVVSAPAAYALEQNYPNPFNPRTQIRFDLKASGRAALVVYNVLGEKIATLVDGMMEAGRHSVHFDASELPAGIYFYKLTTAEFTAVKKMALVK